MTFVSFSQNYEDVLLWRAFKDLSVGFYVDIGVVHPDIGSVTRAFYERGWHGLNVTPSATAHRRMDASRPLDINLHRAVGAVSGESVLYTIKETGLSTLDLDALDAFRMQGHTALPVKVRVETLGSILAERAPADIQFLRLDVTGAEALVLQGCDFVMYRPWVLIVRALAPVSRADSHAVWEPHLTKAGYIFAWFDGLSRFYVSEEKFAAIGHCFSVPPNVFDDFMLAADTDWAMRIGQSEADVRAMSDRIQAAEMRSRDDTRALMEMRVLNEHRIQQIHSLEQALIMAHARVEAEQLRTRHANDWLEAVRRSTSWRAMGPLRVLARRIARHNNFSDEAQPIQAESLPALSMPSQEVDLTVAPKGISRARPARSQPLRIVHQFHSGSARGDAITNSLFLIQRVLRDLGYESEIYCDQPDAELGVALRPSSELPLHGDYVLLVHFSLGFDNFQAISSLAATKVLMYHNITPPALLTRSPLLQHYASLGHEQLSQWKPHVTAALADSEYNALDLRRAGFDVVRSCPLLFDIDAMRAAATLSSLPRQDTMFTLLFVGRLVESKAQDDLVAAFAAFQHRFSRPSRLVLVGRSQSAADFYIGSLHAHIAALGLTDRVIFTGFVDDNELQQWYRSADLYVSLSHHEGFGVPLIEAMVQGVPVLAWPSGAVPYTMGGEDDLLDDRAPDAVASRILELAEDPVRLLAIARRQARSLDRFRLSHHVPILIQALALAGAALPETPKLRHLQDEHLCFAVTGHINGSYSLASVNRGLARSIETVRPGKVRIIPVSHEPLGDLSGLPAEEATTIIALAMRPAPVTGPEIVISQHYPVHVPQHRGDALLAMFFWEESVVPLETVRVLNGAFRAVLAPSGFVAKTLIDSGISVPVYMVGQSPDLAAYRALGAKRRTLRRGDGPFCFLHVSSCMQRKGVDILLAAFTRAFRRGDPVRLVIKTFPNPHNDVAGQLAAMQAADPEMPEVELIDQDLDKQFFLDLYRHADAMVLPTRGEGFNLPAAEAMAARIPVIVTGFGGQSDFCDAGTARLLSSRFAPSTSHLATGHSVWVEPSEDDLVAALREAYEGEAEGDAGTIATRVRAAAARMDTMMTDEGLVRRIADAAADVIATPPPSPARVLWITTWDVRCDVAEYARHILSSWPAGDAIGDVVVLADDRTAVTGDAGPRVRIGWRLGEDDNIYSLATILAQEDPTILIVQYHPGLLPWPHLARFLHANLISKRTIVVTLHNTSHLAELQAADRKDAVVALRAIARVIVHGIADLELLKGFGITDNVVLLPYGVSPDGIAAARRSAPPRKLPPDAIPVIGCYGFFLPGKGIVHLIAAVALLKATWPNLRLRLVNASYGTPKSEAEIDRCRTAAQQAGLADALEWHTDFMPEEQSRTLLASCDLVVLPYQAAREATSAALRFVLAAGVPVAVTPLSIFDDAGDAVMRLDGVDPGTIADGVRLILQDRASRHELLVRADAWMQRRAWPDVAERMQGLLLGLSKQTKRGLRPLQ